jgi:hypothetical protein
MSRIFSSAEPDPQLTWTAMIFIVNIIVAALEQTTLFHDGSRAIEYVLPAFSGATCDPYSSSNLPKKER